MKGVRISNADASQTQRRKVCVSLYRKPGRFLRIFFFCFWKKMRYEYIKTESTRDVIAALIKDIYLCIYLQHVSSSSHRYQYQRHRGVFPCLVYHDRGICFFFFFFFSSYLALLLFFRDYLRDERF